MAAQLLYHGLTTGSGVQTLGEEYCDILQVTGKPQLQRCMEGLVNTQNVLQMAFMVRRKMLCKAQQPLQHYCYHTYTKTLQAPLSRHELWLMPLGLVGLPPGTVQRGLLVLLQTLVPYLADRVGGTAEAPLHLAPWASHYSSDQHTTISSSPVASTGACIYPLLLNNFCLMYLLKVYPAWPVMHRMLVVGSCTSKACVMSV